MMRYFREITATIFIALTLSGLLPAVAQTIPGSADATRVQNTLENANQPPQKTDLLPPIGGAQPELPQEEAIPENAAEITFVLQGISLDGVTVYRPSQLEALWKKYLGKTVSLKQAYDIAAALTAKYRADGYLLSSAFVPAQKISGGIVHIGVVEGYIQDVHMSGDIPPSRLTAAFRKHVLSLGPLNIRVLEREMLILNDLPGTHFRAVLKAISGPPDAAAEPVVFESRRDDPSSPAALAANDAGTDVVELGHRQGAPPASEPVVFARPHDDAANLLARKILEHAEQTQHMEIIPLGHPQPANAPPAADAPLPAESWVAAAAPAPAPAPGALSQPWIAAAAPSAPPPKEGGVLLDIVGTPAKAWHGSASIDNSGSRFLGPWLATAQLSIDRGLPAYQQAQITLNTSVPDRELISALVKYMIPLTADGMKIALNAGITRGRPGYTLEPNHIVADSVTWGPELDWDAVRQRDENLRLVGGLDYLDSRTDLLGVPFVRDRIAALKIGLHFDKQEGLSGFSVIDTTLKKGVPILGASESGDLNLSRAGGNPEFLSLSTTAYQFENLSEVWNALLGVTAQLSDAPLLSSQQFGYGGPSFGRAYDPSEIVGDAGVAASAELRYDGMKAPQGFHFQPFGFYDIGEVWNRGAGLPSKESAASAGVGMRVTAPKGITSSLTVAAPLTRKAANPQWGNGSAARMVFSLAKQFN